MVGGHLTAKKNHWYVVLSLKHPDGRRYSKWIATGLTVSGNKRKAEELLAELRQQYSVSHTGIAAKEMFTDYLTSWLQSVKPTIAATTFRSYQYLIQGVYTYFAPKKLRLIGVRPLHIQAYYERLYDNGLSPNSVLHYHAILHKLFADAVRLGHISKNPMEGVLRPAKGCFTPSPYNESELKQLFACIVGHPLEVLIKLTAVYGLRRSEVLGLRWRAFDFVKNTVTINHTVYQERGKDGKTIVKGRDVTKSKSSLRTFPMTEPIKEMLLAYQREKYGTKNPPDGSYLFTNKAGTIMKPAYITAAFSKLLAEKGLRHIRLHDLRHASAGVLLANRVPLIEVQQWLGHSTIRITADLYSHLEYEVKQRSAAVMKERLLDDKREND